MRAGHPTDHCLGVELEVGDVSLVAR